MTNSYRIQYTEIKPGGAHAAQDESLRGDRGDVVRFLGARKVLEGSVRVRENIGALSDREGVDIGGLGWNPEPVANEPAPAPKKRAPRVRNPRRVLLDQVRDMKRRLDRLISNWDVASTVFEPKVELKRCDPKYYRHLPVGEDGLVEVEFHNGTWRKREAHEYPENQRAEWAYTCHTLDAIIREAELAREAAYQRWLALDPSIVPASKAATGHANKK